MCIYSRFAIKNEAISNPAILKTKISVIGRVHKRLYTERYRKLFQSLQHYLYPTSIYKLSTNAVYFFMASILIYN